ncbi:filamentous hemagglutinin family protein [Paraburkholderia sp. WSM4175]|uniref:two-partner secretion domain-containing protein n=1 Tax=Paraburkholderia sp. WSM4175 TaxID=2991072 RepID=UPI003D19869D
MTRPALSLLFLCISVAGLSATHLACAAGVLPQGGQYVAGAGTISNRGNALLVTQPGSTRGVIDWNSFSVGAHNRVTFDNGSGATLNRVTGGSVSAILGRCACIKGDALTLSGESNASVINLGKISDARD